MSININGETYLTLSDYMNDESKVDKVQRVKIDFAVPLIGKLIEAREEKGLSQRELAKMSGVKQPAIARIESMRLTPQIDTFLKVLSSFGYKLDIVPIPRAKK